MADQPPNDDDGADDGPVPISFTAPLAGSSSRPPADPPAPPPGNGPPPDPDSAPESEETGRPVLQALPDPSPDPELEPLEIEERPWLSPMASLAALPDPDLTDSPVTHRDDGQPADSSREQGVGQLSTSPAAGNGTDPDNGGTGALAMAAGLAVSVAALRSLERGKNKDERSRTGTAAGGAGGQRRSGGTSVTGGGTGTGAGGAGSRAGHRSGGLTPHRSGSGRASGGTGSGGLGARGGGGGSRPGPLRTTNQSAGAGAVGSRTAGGTSRRGGGTLSTGGGRTGLGQSLVRDGAGRAGTRLEHRRSDVTPLIRRDRRSTGAGGTGGGTGRTASPKNGRSGRTTLAQALGKDTLSKADPRLKRRRAGMRPPIWRRDDPKHRATNEKESKPSTSGGTADGTKTSKPGASSERTTKPGTKRKRSRRKYKKDSSWWRPSGWSKARERTRTRARSAADGSDSFGDEGDFWTDTGPRRTPWESAAEAAPQDHGTKVWRADKPPPPSHHQGQVTTGARTLGPAPTPHHPRPGTAAPATNTSKKEASVPTPRSGRSAFAVPASARPYQPAATSSGHDTDVKLDDVLRHLHKLSKASWAAHQRFVWAADGARKLQGAMLDLATLLATRNNVIGRRTRAALSHLAESMDGIARAATRAQASTLASAELTEALARDMDAAYRPMQQAAADQGLATPSARIHNQP